MNNDQNIIPTRTPSSWDISPMVMDAVEQMKKMNPEAYRRAQEFGEFLLNSPLADPDKFADKRDINGEEIIFNKIKRDIEFSGITKDDLNDYEIEVLKIKLGDNWESIFNN